MEQTRVWEDEMQEAYVKARGPHTLLVIFDGAERWGTEEAEYMGDCRYRFRYQLHNAGRFFLRAKLIHTVSLRVPRLADSTDHIYRITVQSRSARKPLLSSTSPSLHTHSQARLLTAPCHARNMLSPLVDRCRQSSSQCALPLSSPRGHGCPIFFQTQHLPHMRRRNLDFQDTLGSQQDVRWKPPQLTTQHLGVTEP